MPRITLSLTQANLAYLCPLQSVGPGLQIGMLVIIALGTILFLAYANGANDNFKGVATLYGSHTAGYRTSLAWATLTTALGSLTALVFAGGLLATFSGKGLVPDAVVATKSFPVSVGLAAAITVMLATRLGFPISTTHALTGALVGAGLVASDAGVNLGKLASSFFLPLLISPFLALLLSIFLYPLIRWVSAFMKVEMETCVCIGSEVVQVLPGSTTRREAIAMFSSTTPSVAIGTTASCVNRYQGNVLGLRAGTLLDGMHFLSAGVVSFARGLNDTPKIAAILLAAATLPPTLAIAAVAVFMAVGGLVNSWNVAETMSHKVTEMTPGQGFAANLVTGFLVIFASKAGLPVSTTHVSCGSLFGIGTVTRQAHWKTISSILLAWVTTLPVAGVLGATFYTLCKIDL